VQRRQLKWLPALLAPLAVLWAADSRGVFPSPAVVVATAALCALLVAAEGRRGLLLAPPARWLAGLVAWASVTAAVRPVDRVEAARFVAVGVVALLIVVLAGRPRAAAWGRLGVVATGAVAAAWLVAERVAIGGRPGGPFDNPNVAATVIAVALALLPQVRWHGAAQAGCAALLVGGLVTSGSRAGMLAAVAVAGIWVLCAAGRAVRVTVAAVLVVAAAGLAARVATDRDPLRFERLRIWAVAWRTATAELPLGSGPAGFADAAIAHNFARDGELARYHRLPALAESDGLEVFATLGLPGVLLAAGLCFAVVRAAASRRPAWAPLAAVAVTSAVHTQLPLPAVAWTAALAVAGSLPRLRGRRVVLRPAVSFVGLAVAAPALVVALGGFPGERVAAQRLAAAGVQALARGESDDAALADAEASTWLACMRRPRWAAAWSTLGGIRLDRALERDEGILAAAAVDAFVAARAANPLDVWAALGEGQARRALGENAAAARAFEAAARLEPNCAPAWVEIGLLRLEGGELATARHALARVEAALALARRYPPESGYERELVRVDRVSLMQLRVRCGVRG
jgi:hypothetical protein